MHWSKIPEKESVWNYESDINCMEKDYFLKYSCSQIKYLSSVLAFIKVSCVEFSQTREIPPPAWVIEK